MSDFYLLDENKQPVRVEGDDQLSIFGGAHDMYQERYASHEAALAGHARALELAIRGLPQ